MPLYWIGVLTVATVIIFVLTVWVVSGGLGDMFEWIEDHTSGYDGEIAAKIFSVLGIVVAAVGLTFCSFAAFPLMAVIALGSFFGQLIRNSRKTKDSIGKAMR